MFDRILPEQIDNAYRGHWLGKWLFVGVILARLAIGLNSTINTRFVAMSADGIPLDKYGSDAADAVVALFAISGFSFLLSSLLGVVVFLRYRAMIPLLYLFLLLDQVGRRVLLLIHPIAKSGVPSANLGLGFVLLIFGATILGFALSVWPSAGSSKRESPRTG
jgi:hypothetical protein